MSFDRTLDLFDNFLVLYYIVDLCYKRKCALVGALDILEDGVPNPQVRTHLLSITCTTHKTFIESDVLGRCRFCTILYRQALIPCINTLPTCLQLKFFKFPIYGPTKYAHNCYFESTATLDPNGLTSPSNTLSNQPSTLTTPQLALLSITPA